ncbi:hypothetical protein F2P81_009707 [Scophthalmus maximus]|uniref:Uncharacterized protein n=1 Tax=Scophthalmus maximus TaxID=52904 RepID=A0A6A4SS58_SCOMX|nr:hypothetical protein F2P81_009707 [Scophthalmus maximus]
MNEAKREVVFRPFRHPGWNSIDELTLLSDFDSFSPGQKQLIPTRVTETLLESTGRRRRDTVRPRSVGPLLSILLNELLGLKLIPEPEAPRPEASRDLHSATFPPPLVLFFVKHREDTEKDI